MQTPNQAADAEILSGFVGAICLKCSEGEGFMKKGQAEKGKEEKSNYLHIIKENIVEKVEFVN